MRTPGEGEVQSWLQQKLQTAPLQQAESQRPQGSTLGQKGYPHGVHAGPTGTETCGNDSLFTHHALK